MYREIGSSVPLFLSLSPFSSLFLPLSLYPFLSLSVYHSISLSSYLSISISIFLSLYLFSLSNSIYLYLTLSIST
jgi:hypothetical protein